MKKTTVVLVAALTFALGFVACVCLTVIANSQRLEYAVAIRCDEMQSNAAQGQAHVYLKPGGDSKEVEVQLAVHFGRGWRIYGPRTLGWVRTKEEAVARWGQIEWRVDGLYVGTGTNQFLLTREQFPAK
jgi:hypothetical protein